MVLNYNKIVKTKLIVYVYQLSLHDTVKQQTSIIKNNCEQIFILIHW